MKRKTWTKKQQRYKNQLTLIFIFYYFILFFLIFFYIFLIIFLPHRFLTNIHPTLTSLAQKWWSSWRWQPFPIQSSVLTHLPPCQLFLPNLTLLLSRDSTVDGSAPWDPAGPWLAQDLPPCQTRHVIHLGVMDEQNFLSSTYESCWPVNTVSLWL